MQTCRLMHTCVAGHDSLWTLQLANSYGTGWLDLDVRFVDYVLSSLQPSSLDANWSGPAAKQLVAKLTLATRFVRRTMQDLSCRHQPQVVPSAQISSVVACLRLLLLATSRDCFRPLYLQLLTDNALYVLAAHACHEQCTAHRSKLACAILGNVLSLSQLHGSSCPRLSHMKDEIQRYTALGRPLQLQLKSGSMGPDTRDDTQLSEFCYLSRMQLALWASVADAPLPLQHVAPCHPPQYMESGLWHLQRYTANGQPYR